MRLNIYKVRGYRGSEHGYDGKEDYNFKEIIGLPADLPTSKIKSMLAKATAPDRTTDVYIGEHVLLGTVEFDDAKNS